MSRKRKATRKKKMSARRKVGIGNLSTEEYNEPDSVSLKEKYFSNIPWLCTDCEEVCMIADSACV